MITTVINTVRKAILPTAVGISADVGTFLVTEEGYYISEEDNTNNLLTPEES